MKKTLNHLIQLQELVIAKAQQESTDQNGRLEQLSEAIKSLEDQLPSSVRQQFDKLLQKGPNAIVPVYKGVCSACGMSLPVSLAQSVKAGDQLQICPNCARMLYFPSRPGPNRIPKKKRRFEPVKEGISRFSSEELMLPHMQEATRDDVIRALCFKLQEEEFVDDADKLAEEVFRREAIASTAVDHGLAFPHVRGVEGGGLTLAIGTSKKGVHFNDESRKLTRIFFLIVIPTAASAFYLNLLSGLTRTFREKDPRDKLLDADTPKKLWKVMVKATRSSIQ